MYEACWTQGCKMFVFRRRSVYATHFFYLLPVFPPNLPLTLLLLLSPFPPFSPSISSFGANTVNSSHTHSPFPFVIYRAITHSILRPSLTLSRPSGAITYISQLPNSHRLHCMTALSPLHSKSPTAITAHSTLHGTQRISSVSFLN